MVPPLLLYGPSIIGIIIIGILVVANNGPNKASRWFALPMALLAAWLGVQMWAQMSESPGTALVLIRAVSVISCVLALSYYYVIIHYLRLNPPRSVIILLLLTTGGLCLLSLGDKSILNAKADITGISLLEVTPLYYVILLYTLALFVAALVTLYRETRKLSRKERASNYILFYSTLQIVVLSGISSGVLGGIAASQILIVISALVYCGGIFFGIIRHRLFDVRLVAVRSAAYVLSLVTLAVAYFAVAYVVSRLFFTTSVTAGVSFSPVNVSLALLLAFIFQPIKKFFDRVTDSIFYRDRYNSEEFFALLSNVLGTTTDLRGLLERAADIVSMTLKSEQAFFYVRQRDGTHIIAGLGMHEKLLMHEADRLDGYVKKSKQRIITVESVMQNHAVYAIFRHRRIALLLPLLHGGGVIGYLVLGDQLGGRYAVRDLRVLETIADELVIAIQNAMSLEEVRDVNATLQQRVDGATRDLRSKNERLKQLDDTKDEFISMASHQLRTPLTSVKGYVSMILDGDAGEINDQQRAFLNEAFESSNRMAGIIGDFLNVSRLQTGKFNLEREGVDLAEVIENEVQHLENTAGTRGLKLKYVRPAHFPQMQLDKSKIEQVVMNFIDNAIFYAPNTGSVDIELFQRAGRAVFTVRDHGIGVPKSEQASLFTKFFRATNARRKRPDGTGVGLFLAKKVVVAHKGAIIFDSVEGMGSTFGFEIPLR